MPRRSIRRPELEPYQRALALNIDDALKRGQRGDGTLERHWTPWTNSKFAEVAKVAERSIANWRNPDLLMPPDDIQPLLKTFYGNIDRLKDNRATMEKQWRFARGYIGDNDAPIIDWELGKSANLQGVANLVILQTHAPVSWNDGTMRLSITLVISPDRDLSYYGKAITIGLVDALLCVEPGLYQPAYKSRPSQRGIQNFKISAAGDRIVGPLDPDTGMISGEPLGDEYLMGLEVTEGGRGPIIIAIHASRDSFRVLPTSPADPEGKRRHSCSVNQNAVINALFHQQLRTQDDHNRPVLACATLGLRPFQCP